MKNFFKRLYRSKINLSKDEMNEILQKNETCDITNININETK